MFDSLLIANRGEIACRIAGTARRMGLRTIAVFSDADAKARHVRLCDAAQHIGPDNPADSYLHIDRIIGAAKAAGAQAIHPGYGFLAENPGLADACAAAGLIFVGPPAAAMRAMAAKDAARQRMAAAGVPVTPGYDGDDQSDQAFTQAAAALGYPLLVKAAAGGGGRGMRLAERPDALTAALRDARAEARSAFGDDRLLLERYLADARHVEVQIMADAHGGIVHLFDRDCSIQRRRQKLVEEAPAPDVPTDVRAAMAEAAVTCARTIGYVNAGTVEFLLAPDGSFSFMEMNTRLQVEHPVTEAITGVDLVEWQLRVAAGEALPLRQDQIAASGHAVEVRIIAEDPDNGFAPEPGPIALAAWPQGPGIRVDTGYEAGDTVPAAYDSLLAKLIVHGDNRGEALRGMAASLRKTRVGPRPTTIGLLARILDETAFRDGPVSTDWLENRLSDLTMAASGPLADALGLAVWAVLRPDIGNGDPWTRRDGWRLSGHATAHLPWADDQGAALVADATYIEDGLVCLLAGKRVTLAQGAVAGSHVQVLLDGRRLDGHVISDGDALVVLTGSTRTVLHRPATGHGGPDGTAGDGRIIAPLPGKVIEVLVEPGQMVAAGDPLVSLEAMKMQHRLNANRDGRVEAVNCTAGDQVARGDLLVAIAASTD